MKTVTITIIRIVNKCWAKGCDGNLNKHLALGQVNNYFPFRCLRKVLLLL